MAPKISLLRNIKGVTPTVSLFKTIKGVTPIKVGRRIFVSGLYWQVLPNGQNYKDEARKIARRDRERTGKTMDVVFLRRHVDVVQAAFVERGGRARKGTVALAAVATDVLGPTFIAAFALPDGRYALTSSSHDAIIADSDGVFEFDEAKARLLELWNDLSGNVGGTSLPVYAPSELWPGGLSMDITELLAGVKRKHRLHRRPTLENKSALSWLIWVLIAAAGAGVWGLWQSHQDKLAREQTAARQLALEQLRGQSDASISELALMRPWTNQPSAQLFAMVCTKAIGNIPITLDGWVLLNAQCNAKATNASYARTDGRTVLGFVETVQAWHPVATIQLSSDGDLGTVQWPMRLAPAGDENLAPLAGRTNTFMSWWQTRQVPFELTTSASTFAQGYTPPKEAADPRLMRPHWKTARWSIKSTQRTPTRLLEGFDQEGIRVQEVELIFASDGQLNWSIKGEIYGE